MPKVCELKLTVTCSIYILTSETSIMLWKREKTTMPDERYHIYNTEAEALSGNLTLPLEQEVKPPTYVKLNERGGYISQHVENFRLGGVVSFRSAYTQVAGNP